jgi:RNA polymerase sigma factor for flagellar operon FliA
MELALPPSGRHAAHPQPPHEEPSLWAAARAGDAHARGRLIETYLPFARIMAAKLYAARVDHDIEFEDYLQYATVGLIESVDRFDPAFGTLFKTFAAHRIQGAISNGLEQSSEKRTQVATRRRLAAERRDSAAAALDVDGADLFQQLADVAVGLALGFALETAGDDAVADDNGPLQPYGALEMAQLRSRLHALVAGLPQRERLVIKSHYLHHVPFNLIADTMGITKGRVSQIHRNALDQLRKAMRAMRACDVAW